MKWIAENYKISKYLQIIVLLLLMNYLEPVHTAEIDTLNSQTPMVTIHPQEYPHPLRNPHKGFTDRSAEENNEWATLMHSYIKWNEIECDSLDGLEEIKTWCNANWLGVEDRNVKVIPRVYLHWDGDKNVLAG